MPKSKSATYTGSSSPFQASVESLFCTAKGTLKTGTENGLTSQEIREVLRPQWARAFKDETTYEQRISSALIGLQRRLLVIRHKEPAIFGYYRPFASAPIWYVARYPRRPDEVMDIINVYNRRSARALHTVALIEAVRERLDRMKGEE